MKNPFLQEMMEKIIQIEDDAPASELGGQTWWTEAAGRADDSSKE